MNPQLEVFKENISLDDIQAMREEWEEFNHEE